MSKSLFITGASGFIGSQLINFIKPLNIAFLGFSRKKISHDLKWTKNYLDIESYVKADQLCIHLAANNNVHSTEDNEVKITEYLAKLFGSNLIYISSSYVYGNDHKSIITESSETNPINKYSERKIHSEEIVLKNSGTVLRLSNVYGIGMTNNIFNHIYTEFMKNNGLVEVTNSLNIRDFINIKDVCSAIVACVSKRMPGIYNISTGKSTSITALCDIFARYLEIGKNDYQITSTTEDKTMLVLSPSRFYEVYNWQPKIKIDYGVRQWIDANNGVTTDD
jgi:UDP-glucose 4-epimerase